VQVLQSANFSYLDPSRGWDGGVNAFYRLIYRQLVTKAPNDAKDPNAMVPDLAQSLGKVSADGLTWTYKLKAGIKFDTGAPITSKDVKFGISRSWDPEIGIGAPYLKNLIAAPKGYQGPYRSGDLRTIETPDDQTIVFHLKAPFPEFDAALSQPSGTPFPVGTGGGDSFIKDVIASGPYDVEKFTPGSLIQLKRNPQPSMSVSSPAREPTSTRSPAVCRRPPLRACRRRSSRHGRSRRRRPVSRTWVSTRRRSRSVT
jgi:peptide/nickel transport system substrate-binding protein